MEISVEPIYNNYCYVGKSMAVLIRPVYEFGEESIEPSDWQIMVCKINKDGKPDIMEPLNSKIHHGDLDLKDLREMGDKYKDKIEKGVLIEHIFDEIEGE